MDDEKEPPTIQDLRDCVMEGNMDFFLAIVNLFSNGELNTLFEDGTTLLHLSCLFNRPKFLECLMGKLTVNPNITNKDGMTPLMQACTLGHLKLVRILLRNPMVDHNCIDKEGLTALRRACHFGYYLVVRELLVSGRDFYTGKPGDRATDCLFFVPNIQNRESLVKLVEKYRQDPNGTRELIKEDLAFEKDITGDDEPEEEVFGSQERVFKKRKTE
jgi:ankyrin repeat protein